MSKSKQKFRAVDLRRRGMSMKMIARELEVSIASVSNWCRDVELSKEQIEQLSRNARDPYYGKRGERIERQRKERIAKTVLLMNEGRDNIGVLNQRELMLVGTALYWAEGYKKDNQAGLGSSDPKMLLLYVKWLRECFDFSTDDMLFRVTVNKAHEYRINEIIRYWASLFNIGEDRFQKPFYQKVRWQKTYENPEEYFGVLRIRPRRSADLLRKILGMIEGLKEQV